MLRLLFTIIYLGAFLGFSQTRIEESGLPIIENYTPKDFNGHPQSFSITQDDRGILFFGNANGLLEFDGVRWNLNAITGRLAVEGAIVYSLRYDGEKLWMGLEDDFGYMDIDSSGNISFRSIYTTSFDSLENFGPVWDIHFDHKNDRYFFQADYHVFELKSDSVIKHETEEVILKSMLSREILYLNLEKRGLNRMFEGKIIKVPGASKLGNKDVREIIRVNKRESLLFTANDGIYAIKYNDFGFEVGFSQSTLRLSEYLKNKDLGYVSVIDSKQIAISLYGKGFIVVKDLKAITHSINRETGLQDDIVKDFFVDQQKNLWVTLDNGISKIELNYPLSLFNRDLGIEGTIEECIRYDGALMAAGAEGIFRLETEYSETYNQDKYVFKNYFPAQTWGLSVFRGSEEQLIACLNEEVVAFDQNDKLTSILECYPWIATQSDFHDSLLYIGTDPGFSVVEKINEGWQTLGEIPEIEEPIDRIVEQNDSVIWLGTRSFGLYRLENLISTDTGLTYDKLDYYEVAAGLPEGEVKPCRYGDRMLFSTAEGIYELVDREKFIPAKGILGEAKDSYIFKLNTSPSGQLWAIVPGDEENRFGPLVGNNGNLELWSKAFNPISSEIVYSFHFDGDSIVWLSGPNGIFRYDAKQDYDYKQDFNTLIRKVSVNYDSVIFAGNFQNDNGQIIAEQPKGSELELEHDINSFTFEYAAQAEAAPEKQQYSYFLEGFSKEWSKWKNEAKAVFTNLEPGDYVFKVKAKNIFEHESVATEYRFSIAKPWWETPWYYLGQTLFFIILIVLTVLLNRGEGQSKFAEIVALITIITVFEFLIMIVEPMFEEYTGGVPVFQLAMNILLALSLNPAEAFIRKQLKKTKS